VHLKGAQGPSSLLCVPSDLSRTRKRREGTATARRRSSFGGTARGRAFAAAPPKIEREVVGLLNASGVAGQLVARRRALENKDWRLETRK
jgi:hypothetical protein